MSAMPRTKKVSIQKKANNATARKAPMNSRAIGEPEVAGEFLAGDGEGLFHRIMLPSPTG